jgi:hypothetical protein
VTGSEIGDRCATRGERSADEDGNAALAGREIAQRHGAELEAQPMRLAHTGSGLAVVSDAARLRASEAANASPTLAAISAGHAKRLAGNSGASGISPCCCFFAMVETNCRVAGVY